MSTSQGTVAEVARLFLKLGCVGFGGPAAHIAMMRTEVVDRRAWVTDEEFLDLVSGCNLIPGPTSTEMSIMLGYRRAGWPGLLVAGTLFIMPAMLMVLGLAWLYTRYGSRPQAEWLLYGIKPVVIAVVAQALWQLSRTAISGALPILLCITVIALYLLGFHPLILLVAAGALMLLVRHPWLAGQRAIVIMPLAAKLAVAYSPITLFLTFLKIGAVTYGSGYVLLAFLRSDFVGGLGWLTDRQLVDAVAIGQITPGPLFTTATFIGYLVGGFGGATVATIAIFLPAFVLVAVVYPLIPRLRASRVASAALDGVNVAALGLMTAVLIQLGRVSIVDPFTVALCLLGLVMLVRYRISSFWLIAAGGILGLVYHLLGL